MQRRLDIPDMVAGNLFPRNLALLLAYKAQANLEDYILGSFALRSCMKLVMGKEIHKIPDYQGYQTYPSTSGKLMLKAPEA